MVALAGHVIETRYLKDLPPARRRTFAGDDAGDLPRLAVAMGPTKVVGPLTAGRPAGAIPRRGERAPRPPLCRDGAVILQKMTAVHYVARASSSATS